MAQPVTDNKKTPSEGDVSKAVLKAIGDKFWELKDVPRWRKKRDSDLLNCLLALTGVMESLNNRVTELEAAVERKTTPVAYLVSLDFNTNAYKDSLNNIQDFIDKHYPFDIGGK